MVYLVLILMQIESYNANKILILELIRIQAPKIKLVPLWEH